MKEGHNNLNVVFLKRLLLLSQVCETAQNFPKLQSIETAHSKNCANMEIGPRRCMQVSSQNTETRKEYPGFCIFIFPSISYY
jgi:hypothetical protein